MRIVLVRHGPAETRDASQWPDDGLRPLTARGIERTEAAAAGLARLEPKVGAVLSSPLVRAMMTAEILRKALGLEGDVGTLDALAPGGSLRSVVRRLAESESRDTIFLVGHEPDLGRLAGVLLFGAPDSSLPLKKAAACAISFDGL